MYTFASLEEIEAALEQFYPSRLSRVVYTTEHIQQCMENLGNPQDIPRSIHVAGTSGKTSTAYYAAALLQQAGKKVGLLVSPHAERLNERVQIDMAPLDEGIFCKEFAVFMDLVAASGITLSRAELLYGFAYWEFARQRVEYIVVEVGMGGLLDATNVISRNDKVCVITDIGLDHTNVLGDTLPQIAEHKAGIIQLYNHVFCHRQDKEIMDVLQAGCRQKQADLHILENGSQRRDIGFLPLFQQRNFTLGLAAVSCALGQNEQPPLPDAKILSAARVKIPSRMEIFQLGDKTVVLDGAHNPQKLRALSESLRDFFPKEDIALLVAFTGGRGRNIETQAAELAALKPTQVIITDIKYKIDPEAHAPPEEVAEAFKKTGMKAELVKHQARAYQALMTGPESVAVITGSIYLLGELKPIIRQHSRDIDYLSRL